ncbi:MAG: hypothetical protein ACI8RE_003396 [Ilumatobacter sp.]|jgi:hypothetical protein
MIPLDKITTRLRREAKHLRLRVSAVDPAPHPLLHIIGCQRSGTTMLTELLDHDRRIRVFGELGELFDGVSQSHRLRDPDFVRRRLERSGAALNVVKPLVETHRCRELIDLQEGGLALWMFRHYRDVAASNLRRFGTTNGIDNLRPIVEDRDDWRSAGLAPETRSLVISLFDETMPPLDAAALFWYCRNTLWFEANLASDDRVRMCQYEQLVAEPNVMTAALYGWVNLSVPPASTAGFVHSRSVGKGSQAIGDDIRLLCDPMWERLLACDAERSLLVLP